MEIENCSHLVDFHTTLNEQFILLVCCQTAIINLFRLTIKVEQVSVSINLHVL